MTLVTHLWCGMLNFTTSPGWVLKYIQLGVWTARLAETISSFIVWMLISFLLQLQLMNGITVHLELSRVYAKFGMHTFAETKPSFIVWILMPFLVQLQSMNAGYEQNSWSSKECERNFTNRTIAHWKTHENDPFVARLYNFPWTIAIDETITLGAVKRVSSVNFGKPTHLRKQILQPSSHKYS